MTGATLMIIKVVIIQKSLMVITKVEYNSVFVSIYQMKFW
jgi:hypothetical protein